jgi:hypothetical protein
MSKHRAALALSLTALAVAVLGQTPIGHAAVSTVRVALFAQNSAKVNNIKASRTPMPGRLLALNSKAQLPASVLPARSTGQAYVRTIVVHPDPDVTKAGSALIRAVGSITGNSASNPYLVKIEPGVYDLVNQSLVMKEYVDVEGSGQGITTIRSADSSGAGTVVGANNSELRYLTVRNSGTGQQSVAIFTETTSPRFDHVTAISTGSSENYGFHISNGSAVLTNVTASASGGMTAIALANLGGATSATSSSFSASDADGLVVGLLTASGGSMKLQSSALTASGGSIAMGMRSYNGSHTLANVTVSGSGSGLSYGINSGWKTQTPSVQVNQSRVSGQTNSVYAVGGSVRLGASQLSGTVETLNAGTIACAVSYDGSFNPLGADCS